MPCACTFPGWKIRMTARSKHGVSLGISRSNRAPARSGVGCPAGPPARAPLPSRRRMRAPPPGAPSAIRTAILPSGALQSLPATMLGPDHRRARRCTWPSRRYTCCSEMVLPTDSVGHARPPTWKQTLWMAPAEFACTSWSAAPSSSTSGRRPPLCRTWQALASEQLLSSTTLYVRQPLHATR